MLRIFYLFLIPMMAACASRHLQEQGPYEPQHIDAKNDAPDSSLHPPPTPYRAAADTQRQAVIGHTDMPLTKAQPESTLGNFITDATLIAAQKIDSKVIAAVVNYGGIRLSFIPPGPVTRAHMYELMPFDNKLTIVEVPGTVLQQLCDMIAARKGWPVSGITFAIKEKTAVEVEVGGQALNPVAVYKIALSDYNARGGDNCGFLKGLKKRVTSVLIRDAMFDYVAALEKAGRPLHPPLQRRIRYAE